MNTDDPTPPPAPPPSPRPALSHMAVRSSAWSVATGLVTRFLGVVGTLILTRFVAPYDYGEVAAATVVVMTANQISTIGVGIYMLANPRAGRDVTFHATVIHVGLGLVACLAVLATGDAFARLLEAPTLGRYLPGMIAVMAIDRIKYMPQRILIREMKFRTLSLAGGLSEVTYTAVSIAAAAAGWGGMAIVAGNVARAVVHATGVVGNVPWREWAEPARVRLRTLAELALFGLPITVGGMALYALRRWDNLMVSRIFGPATMGAYNLAYNLGEIPAVQVGEQISDVLQAAYARRENTVRLEAVTRSLIMLGLIMTPMAVGLACIAPTLAAALFDRRWAGVGPMLTVLALISVFKPIADTIGGYMQIQRRQNLIAVRDVLTVGVMLAGMWTFGQRSPLWACGAVVAAFAVRLLMSAWMMKRLDGLSLLAVVGPFTRPFAACLPMAAAVLLVREGLAPALSTGGYVGLLLAAEIAVGVIGYLAGVLLFARAQATELVTLARAGLKRSP